VELFCLAPFFFRYREADWPARIETSLGRVETILALTDKPRPISVGRSLKVPVTPGIPVTDPFGITDDPSLPFLAQALDPLKVQHHLEKLDPPPGKDGQLSVQAIQVLRYKPGKRCLIEYHLEHSRVEEISLIGKVRAKGLDHSTYRFIQQLWAAGFGPDSPDGIYVPEPIGVLPELGMWLQRRASGVSAGRLLEGPDGVALARRIAAAAHKLHTAAVHPTRRHTMADELRILHARLQQVIELHPEWAGRIERLLVACDCLGASTPAPDLRGIHRDFYPDQVLVDGEHLYLLDFDMYSLGDPGLDIGNFVAHMTEHALRTTGDPAALSDREDALVERFVELAGESTRPAIQAYTTLTLARHIYLSTKFARRRHTTPALLALCEQRLSECGVSRSIPAHGTNLTERR